MNKLSLEFKIGVFVFLALTILSVLVFKAGDFYMKPGYNVRFVFDYVSGVEEGSPVRLAGVNVGEVTSIHVLRSDAGSTQVEVATRIRQGALIEEDADIRINTLGFLSEKYIEILPGTPGSKTVEEGAVLVGKPPVMFEKMSESGTRLINKIEVTVDNLNNVVTDKQFQASVKGVFNDGSVVMKNLRETTDDLKEAAKSARIVLGRLKDGEGTVGRLLKDDSIAKDLEAFVKDIKAHPWKLLKRN